MKCNQARPGFELVSCPHPATITITPLQFIGWVLWHFMLDYSMAKSVFVFSNNYISCILSIMISMIIIIQADCHFWYEWVYFFPPSALGNTRRERHNSQGPTLTILCWHPPPWTAHLVVSKISTHLCQSRPKLISSDQIPKLNCSRQWSNLNSPFQNPKILRIISSGHDFIHHSIHSNGVSSSISCQGVYYDRWWMSNPFCTGIRVPHLTIMPEPRDTE